MNRTVFVLAALSFGCLQPPTFLSPDTGTSEDTRVADAPSDTEADEIGDRDTKSIALIMDESDRVSAEDISSFLTMEDEFEVTIFSDDEIAAPNGFDLILVAGTASSPWMAEPLETPIVSLNAGLAESFKFAPSQMIRDEPGSSISYQTSNVSTYFPDGVVTIYTSEQSLKCLEGGRPAGLVVIAIANSGGVDCWTVNAAERGAMLRNDEAPVRMMLVSLSAPTAVWTPDAWELLHSAVVWTSL